MPTSALWDRACYAQSKLPANSESGSQPSECYNYTQAPLFFFQNLWLFQINESNGICLKLSIISQIGFSLFSHLESSVSVSGGLASASSGSSFQYSTTSLIPFLTLHFLSSPTFCCFSEGPPSILPTQQKQKTNPSLQFLLPSTLNNTAYTVIFWKNSA